MSSILGSLTGGSETARPARSDMSSASPGSTDENREHTQQQIDKRNDDSNWSTESVAGSSVGGSAKQDETVLRSHKAAPTSGSRSEPLV